MSFEEGLPLEIKDNKLFTVPSVRCQQGFHYISAAMEYPTACNGRAFIMLTKAQMRDNLTPKRFVWGLFLWELHLERTQQSNKQDNPEGHFILEYSGKHEAQGSSDLYSSKTLRRVSPSSIPEKPTRDAVAAFRLTTGHDCLAAHLHRLGIFTEPFCPLCDSGEVMERDHLLRCRFYLRQTK
ncbi:hypothetical protein AVEN_166293-1 [Araneus ventricosus]|uniref:Uncharacterized protein n=1 Tax=Araneus ventricosus TaxID=182803 RepID=A0A4Y2QRD6_ARAVE|nr:hypothetical protein AVEN_166293-1 [Araneus ventricosus]